jgi:hypothetical protein
VIEQLEPATPRRRMTKAETAFLVRCYTALLSASLLANKKHIEPDQSPVLLSVLGDIDEITDLVRWLVYQGHVEHMRPVVKRDAAKKGWQAIDSLRFNNSSALVITPTGVAYATLPVVFEFDADKRDQLAGLKTGQELTIEGKCAGRSNDPRYPEGIIRFKEDDADQARDQARGRIRAALPHDRGELL